ncbi:putative bifunctional diguanylate cyclase/phosphodiesterase [Evansella sp. AB-rgal1]|uniref:putative bifunctional diguanylate cyclase/phosphodiesterase n=1 Tax=Evansella sp. AB-rgal1 TaxID=3242696 RepID=UPI00359DB24C
METNSLEHHQENGNTSTIDPLTGLRNIKAFQSDLQMAIAEDTFEKSFLSILLVDLYKFKYYNDTLGRKTGDKILKKLAQSFLELTTEGIQVYRYSGGEFAIIISNVSSEDIVTAKAYEFLTKVKTPMFEKGKGLMLSATIGISQYPILAKSYDEILFQANIAKYYEGIDKGKDAIHWYDSSIHEKDQEKMVLEKKLMEAVKKNEFELYYQPQIELKSHRVVGVEALIRWNDGHLGPLSPGDFLPIAEELGVMNDIEDWVLQEALLQGKLWYEAGNILRIGINISALQLQRRSFVERIIYMLNETKLPPELVDIEITENNHLYDKIDCLDNLTSLQELGITISIDDFGTGYSSLSYLQRFSFNTLKIDQSFIRDLHTNKNDQLIVSSIIQLAHNMDMKVVAEGVETSDLVKDLYSLHCDEIQGYLYSVPLPANEIIPYIEKNIVSDVLCL